MRDRLRFELTFHFSQALVICCAAQLAGDSQRPFLRVRGRERIGRLLAQWCTNHRVVVHIHHDSTFPESAYRPGQSGNDFKDAVTPLAGELIVPKNTNSAFIGTTLEAQLRASRIRTLVVTGVSTNNSVEATARMAGNLGFDTYLVEDACFTFARSDFRCQLRSADGVHAMSLANLEGEYSTVVTTDAILARDLDGE